MMGYLEAVDRRQDLPAVAARLRAAVIRMSHEAQTPHLGSALSCIDIVAAAYWRVLRIDPQNAADPLRDRFILSKGHAATALYAALAGRGFIPASTLDTFGRDGGPLPEQPSPGSVPGIEAATGSLGHGLSIGIGHALAGRISGRNYRVYVLLSDGECNEGSVWEGALFAAAQKLGNVCVIVDYNKWQATGRSNETMALDPLAPKWASFGWSATEIDGHNFEALVGAMDAIPSQSRKPTAIVAHTIKGRGVSFMEDDNNWHYRIPTATDVGRAESELGLA